MCVPRHRQTGDDRGPAGSARNTDRVRNIDACDAAAVSAFIASRTLAENMAIFEAAEVTANPVYEIDQLLDDPHVHGRGVLGWRRRTRKRDRC